MTKSMQLPTTTTQQQQQQPQLQPKPDNDMDNNNNNCTVTSSKKKKKHKKKSKSTSSKTTDFTAKTQADFAAKTQADMVDAMMNHHVIRHGDHKDSHHTSKNSTGKIKEEDSFWSSSNNTEERQKIREFWLQLGEDERRSLVKVEKEAVLRKMKEQQKHSCNCSVCGKKRTAIEDELEVLYDAYYEELEQYANHQQQTRGSVNPLHAGYLPSETMYEHGYDDTDHLDEDDEDEDEDEEEEEDDDDDLEEEEEEEEDEEDEEEDEEEEEEEEDDDDEEEDDDEEDDDDDDDDDEIITRPPIATYAERSRFEEMTHIRHTPLSRASPNGDHFSFGNSLTVKGGILTVADDLLKNDGKKFLDMMERLAERRMQKEDNTSDQSNNYFQEDEDDDDNFEDEEDDDTRTEEQRMEEGRRMFQIFAARMFEQRVLAAYREKVAQERQQRLLEELEEEERLREERETKKQKEREKKKDKKRQMKQQQEAERLAREAKKKAEEEALKREKEKKLALERQKREQERLQKEEEKKHREEERLKKEEEKKRRIKEEKERATEREKKRKEKEEKERLEKEKLDKELKEKSEQSKREAKEKIPSPIIPIKTTTSPPPGIPMPENIDDSENRQQVLINALVGPRPLIPSNNTTTPIRPQLQQPSFMPSHLDILQNGPSSSLMSNTCSDTTNSSSIMGIFNNRVGSPLESNNPSRQGRSITPIAPIGQPLNGRRVSSVPLHDMQTPSVDSFPSSIKRPSAVSPFDTEAGPRSFFSNFLFGEPNRNNSAMPMMAPSEYDMRFAPPPQPLDRRFSNDVSGPNWTNGWTASSVLSDNVHGKLFGDALPDRTAMTLERVKIAYQKLNEITQTRIFRGPNNQYHTLVQLHCMMNDLYCDFQVDIRELYEVLIASPLSGFQCVNHAQHGMVVLYDPIVGLRNSPTQNSSLHNNSPPRLNHNLSPNNPSLPPSHPLQGNTSALFGSMS